MHDVACRYWTGAMQDSGYGLPRIQLLQLIAMTLTRMHATGTPLALATLCDTQLRSVTDRRPPVRLRWEAVRLTDAANPFLSYDAFVTSERRYAHDY
jgi:hypothetical protein